MFFVGLDIGTSGVKIIVVRKKKRRVELVDHFVIPLPPGFVKAGAVSDPEGVGNAIVSQMERLKSFKRSRIVASVCGRQVITRVLDVPLASEKEIRNFLQLEVERLFPSAEAVYDFNIVGHSEEGTRVLIVATYRKTVDALIKSLETAGIFPAIIDVDTIALVNLYNRMSVEGVAMLLDIGAGGSRIAVFKEDEILLLRSSLIGGNMITDAIRHAKQVGFDEAESMKIKGKLDEELMISIEAVFEDLYREITRAFDYLIGIYRENPVSGIYLTGGGVLTPGLLRWLQDRVNVPVSLEDRWGEIDSGDMTHVQRKMFEVSLGLALRGVER